MLFFPWWQVLIAFVIIMFTMGLITAAVSVPSHLVEAADFPMPVGEPLHYRERMGDPPGPGDGQLRAG